MQIAALALCLSLAARWPSGRFHPLKDAKPGQEKTATPPKKVWPDGPGTATLATWLIRIVMAGRTRRTNHRR